MSASHQPHVSVVVPIYNVEQYLYECLESLAHQSLDDIEVVMVDDGSTDGSARIAASFTESDPRFVLVQQPNGGLGHARNTGAARARGTYLAFVDSDDVVRPDAYQLLAGSLDRTGSDFATGNFLRLTTSGTRQAGMVFTGYYANRPRTHVRKHPALLYDRTAWNKLFRRTFWDHHGFRWPEGVLYEDIPVTLPAHVLARSVDVIREPVYLWRERAGEAASITQRRTELRAIQDRFAAVDGVSRFLAEHGEHTLKRLYDKSAAEQDFRYFLAQLDEAGEVVQKEFLRLVNDFFDRAEPTVFDDLPALQRLEWHLVRRRLLPELLEVVRFEKSGRTSRIPWVRRGRRIYGSYPFRGDPRLTIPDEVYRLSTDELPVTARIEQVWWDGDVLRLSGYAFIALLAVDSEGSGRLRLTLEESGHAESVVPLAVRRVRRTDVTELTSPDGTCYDWAGWEAAVPLSALHHHGAFRTGTWRLRLDLRSHGVTRRDWLAATDPGPARRPGWRYLDGARVVPTTIAGSFGVEVATLVAHVELATSEGQVLELAGLLVGQPLRAEESGVLAVRSDGVSTETAAALASTSEADGATSFVCRLDLGQLLAEVPDNPIAVEWELFLHPGGTSPRLPLSAAQDLVIPRLSLGTSAEVRLRVTRTSRLLVERRAIHPEAESIRRVDGALEVSGRYAGPNGPATELVLRGPSLARPDDAPMTVTDLSWSGSRFTARLDSAAAADLPRPDGPWGLVLLNPGASTSPLPIDVGSELLGTLPVHLLRDGELVTLVDVEGELTVFGTADGGGPGPRSTPPARSADPAGLSATSARSSAHELRPPVGTAATQGRRASNGGGADAAIRVAERLVPRRVLRKVPPMWRARMVRAVNRAGQLVRR